MILTAVDLFRLDVMLSGDTLQTIVRNLSTGKLSLDEGADKPLQAFGFGEIDVYEPGMASLSFALGSGSDRVCVTATMSTLRFAHRGTVRITAHAVIGNATSATVNVGAGPVPRRGAASGVSGHGPAASPATGTAGLGA